MINVNVTPDEIREELENNEDFIRNQKAQEGYVEKENKRLESAKERKKKLTAELNRYRWKQKWVSREIARVQGEISTLNEHLIFKDHTLKRLVSESKLIRKKVAASIIRRKRMEEARKISERIKSGEAV